MRCKRLKTSSRKTKFLTREYPSRLLTENVAANKLLQTRSTFSKSVMVSVVIKALRRTDLIFIESGVKIWHWILPLYQSSIFSFFLQASVQLALSSSHSLCLSTSLLDSSVIVGRYTGYYVTTDETTQLSWSQFSIWSCRYCDLKKLKNIYIKDWYNISRVLLATLESARLKSVVYRRCW